MGGKKKLTRTGFWLMKSEPDVFGIDDLKRVKKEPWDGVRNYQARNFMMSMEVGDKILFYHSNAKPPGVAGLATVSRKAFPDHTQFDSKSKYYDSKSDPENPRWWMVEVQFQKKFDRLISLDELREAPFLEGILVTKRGMRLSVQPVSKAHYEAIVKMA